MSVIPKSDMKQELPYGCWAGQEKRLISNALRLTQREKPQREQEWTKRKWKREWGLWQEENPPSTGKSCTNLGRELLENPPLFTGGRKPFWIPSLDPHLPFCFYLNSAPSLLKWTHCMGPDGLYSSCSKWSAVLVFAFETEGLSRCAVVTYSSDPYQPAEARAVTKGMYVLM